MPVRYGMILNALLGTLYITVGTFNGLITFIGGYFIFDCSIKVC